MSLSFTGSILLPTDGALRRETLIRLRWLAVCGQTLAVLVVHLGLGFPLPLGPCLMVIALSAWLNVLLRRRRAKSRRLEPREAAILLGYDIIQLAVLLFLTGGLHNPFVFLFLAPVLISATTLPPAHTLVLGATALVAATLLLFFHLPLPWPTEESFDLPFTYLIGVWCSIVLAIVFIGAYAFRVAHEARELSDALAATELVLAREQHLTQLDGLAAAAAHELGTPLATIALVVKEIARDTTPEHPHAEDFKLLAEQTQRCRDILRKLTALKDPEGAPFDRMALSQIIEETVAPHRNFGIDIDILREGERTSEPVGPRNPGLIYGLGNLVENAVDFASTRVQVTSGWDGDSVSITITDDGPGFPPDIIGRLGDPYVTTRGRRVEDMRPSEERDSGGLGLGFFIAKTLIERSGAKLTLANRSGPEAGAVITITWSRAVFEHRSQETQRQLSL